MCICEANAHILYLLIATVVPRFIRVVNNLVYLSEELDFSNRIGSSQFTVYIY